jgi:hypothetical protein
MAAAARLPSSTNTLLFMAGITCLFIIVPPSAAQSCASYTFSNNHAYASCASLGRLDATLHYNYTADTNTVPVAFRAPLDKKQAGWVAWGLNPNGTGMVGTQAVVAFQHSNGSLVAYPTLLDSYAPSMAPAEQLVFPVSDVAAAEEHHVSGKKEMVVYATVALPGTGSKFNHVWQ